MEIVYFLISFVTSTIGAICGIGGGVIIKPVLDCLGTFGVSTITFLSGCTVLSMAIVSLLRKSKNSIAMDRRVTITLAVGATIGGLVGKIIFSYFITAFGKDSLVSLIQSIILMIINICVFIYVRSKNIKALNINNLPSCVVIGVSLGMISSFLGIGGGPINLAVLYYFFSMTPKEAALNSIFIILFSQITSLISTIISGSVPPFKVSVLVLMCLGGVCGGIAGSKISSRASDNHVRKLFTIVLVILILLNIYNITKFISLSAL